MHWSYCSLAPSHQYILPIRFPFIPLVIFLGLLPPHHIQNICQTYNGNSLVFEKNGSNNADAFWQLQIFIWIHFWGVHQWSLHWFRQWLWNNKETSHWLIGIWETVMFCKKAFFNVVLLIGIFWFSYANAISLTNDKSTLVLVVAWCGHATSCYLIKSWYVSVFPYGVMHKAKSQWVNCTNEPKFTIAWVTRPE